MPLLPLLLLACFLVFPVAEIFVIIQVGQAIGAPATIALLLIESALGAWIVKHEGRRAWAALQDTLRTGRLPDRELSDAALILVGGTLLLTPGFVTDVFGFVFVLPFTRPVVRVALASFARRRVEAQMRTYAATGAAGARGSPRGPTAGESHPPNGSTRVVRGDVVDDGQG